MTNNSLEMINNGSRKARKASSDLKFINFGSFKAFAIDVINCSCHIN